MGIIVISKQLTQKLKWQVCSLVQNFPCAFPINWKKGWSIKIPSQPKQMMNIIFWFCHNALFFSKKNLLLTPIFGQGCVGYWIEHMCVVTSLLCELFYMCSDRSIEVLNPCLFRKLWQAERRTNKPTEDMRVHRKVTLPMTFEKNIGWNYNVYKLCNMHAWWNIKNGRQKNSNTF